VIAEDVRDFQSWSNHGRRRYGAGGFSLLRISLMVSNDFTRW
jgi:hypothetical protein